MRFRASRPEPKGYPSSHSPITSPRGDRSFQGLIYGSEASFRVLPASLHARRSRFRRAPTSGDRAAPIPACCLLPRRPRMSHRKAAGEGRGASPTGREQARLKRPWAASRPRRLPREPGYDGSRCVGRAMPRPRDDAVAVPDRLPESVRADTARLDPYRKRARLDHARIMRQSRRGRHGVCTYFATAATV